MFVSRQTEAPPAGGSFSLERHVLRPAGPRRKSLFGNQSKVLNLEHLKIDIYCPLYFVLCPLSSVRYTLSAVRYTLLIMQNKPNFKFDQMAVTKVLTRTYDKRTLGKRGKNKPNSNPIKPNHKNAGMNATNLLTMCYGNSHPPARTQFKPNQTQLQNRLYTPFCLQPTQCAPFLFFSYLRPRYNLAIRICVIFAYFKMPISGQKGTKKSVPTETDDILIWPRELPETKKEDTNGG